MYWIKFVDTVLKIYQLKTCKTCLEYKRKNYDKHKNKVKETRRTKYKEHEEYRKKKEEQIQNYRDKVAFCNVM